MAGRSRTAGVLPLDSRPGGWSRSGPDGGEVRAIQVCRCLMRAPALSPVVALTYRACVDKPARFQPIQASERITGSRRDFTNPAIPREL